MVEHTAERGTRLVEPPAEPAPSTLLRAPARAARMRAAELDAFDDEGLRVFLDPSDGGVDPVTLGRALHHATAPLVRRVLDALPQHARDLAADALAASPSPAEVRAAERQVVAQLFWPLLYWCHPDEFCELVEHEQLAPALIDLLELEGRTVCDIGAGAGRFSLAAARRGAHVIAVDAVPPLLQRLQRLAHDQGVEIDLRRGSFATLPLDDDSVDVAVAAASFMTTGPHGGERALHEAERVTRPGGMVAVLWPERDEWFVERGYRVVEVPGDRVRHFAGVATARRLCADYYGASAARWVAEHNTPDVPFAVLGIRPPAVACVRRV